MKNNVYIVLFIVLIFNSYSLSLFSQHDKVEDGKLIISGYIQSQYQSFFVPDSIGATTKHFAYFSGGNFVNDNTSNRFMVRRGRLSLSYKQGFASSRMSLDFTERGFRIKDMYISATDPYLESFHLTAGLFNRPFGYEIAYSSQFRETPERSRIIQTLFPGERDLGAKLSFSLPKESPFSFFRLDAAIVNGNGSAVETDNYKDFIGSINIYTPESVEGIKASAGFSYYDGKIQHVYEPVDTLSSNVNTKFYIYRFGSHIDENNIEYRGFMIDSAMSRASGMTGIGVERKYYSVNGQLEFNTPFGKTELKGEYIWGVQPTAVNNNFIGREYLIYNEYHSFSPSGPSLGVSWPLYDQPQPYNPTMAGLREKNHSTLVRNFSGGYIYVVQNIMETNHQIVIKYDWYNPNSDVEGKDINLHYYNDTLIAGMTLMSPADVSYSTIGIGWNWKINENLKFTLYYENVRNEITNIPHYYDQDVFRLGRRPSPGFMRDIKDDVLTVRLQYNF